MFTCSLQTEQYKSYLKIPTAAREKTKQANEMENMNILKCADLTKYLKAIRTSGAHF